jgi:triosephosphate isomerase
MRALIAGNWKMNGLAKGAKALAAALKEKAEGAQLNSDLLVCPPFPYLGQVAQELAGSRIALGGQDCHAAGSGAHTGDTAAQMLRDVGCSYVIVGHSERRGDHGETDTQVRAKAEAAQAAGLVPIVCVGETEKERNAEQTMTVIARQVKGSVPAGMDAGRLVVAYEPVWAIGTAMSFGKRHGFIDRRVIGNLVEKKQLVKRDAEEVSDERRGIPRGAMQIGIQERVDFAAPTKGSIGELCQKSPVSIGQYRVLKIVIK